MDVFALWLEASPEWNIYRALSLRCSFFVVLVQRDTRPDTVSHTAPRRQGVWTPFYIQSDCVFFTKHGPDRPNKILENIRLRHFLAHNYKIPLSPEDENHVIIKGEIRKSKEVVGKSWTKMYKSKTKLQGLRNGGGEIGDVVNTSCLDASGSRSERVLAVGVLINKHL